MTSPIVNNFLTLSLATYCILFLLHADDANFLSDRKVGLRHPLQGFVSYSHINLLPINYIKSKIMHFQKNALWKKSRPQGFQMDILLSKCLISSIQAFVLLLLITRNVIILVSLSTPKYIQQQSQDFLKSFQRTICTFCSGGLPSKNQIFCALQTPL